MFLDGFAGPNRTLEEPLGAGGERLHEWVIESPTGVTRLQYRAAS